MDDEERKKKLARLSGGLLDDAAVPGASSDVVNLSLQLNPKLLENRDAAAVMKEVENASNQRGTAPAPGTSFEGAINKSDDLAKLVQALQEKLKGERERIVREEKRLQEEKKLLNVKGLERVIEAVVTIDPNMVSPYTLMVLEDHKQFLRELGFDVRKVQERRKALGR